MRAALLEASEKPLTIVDDIDIEDPRSGEVRVRVSHCGVCHSDLSLVNGTFPFVSATVLGHEAAGVVDAVGPGVTALAPGDKVVLTPIPVCNACYWCARGEYGCCVNAVSISTGTFVDGRTPLSRQGVPVLRGVGLGGFAEFVITTETGAIKVEPDTPLDVACVIGCAVQTGVGAVLNTARVPEGATVLVAGAGGIGISIVQGARVAGATTIIVSDPVAERRAMAKRFGATDVVDPIADNVIGAVQELTSGIGVDYAFDAVGAGPVIESCIWSTRNGGTTVMVGAGGIDQTVTLAPPVMITMSERKIMGCLLGSCNGRRDIPRLLALWRAGRIDLEGMITARRPLAEINEAFADMTAGLGLRTVLTVSGARMDVSLPPQLEAFVRSQVRNGAYADEQEVVSDALRQMRALVKAAEDPTVSGLVRDAMGIANQAQREVAHVLQIADRETTVLGEVVGHATSLANVAFDVVRKVPGARELDRVVRGPVERLTSTAEKGEVQAKAIRQNLEATAKALGLLTSLLERVNSASRAVNSVILPEPNS